MPIYAWVLLAFAAWTLIVLFASVGVYRWSRILTGRQEIRTFRGDVIEGADWYQRAMRAHANCVENLPVYGAIAVAALALEMESRTLDILALAVISARVLQSLVHIVLPLSNAAVSFRFVFFFVQAAAFVWMIALIAIEAAAR